MARNKHPGWVPDQHGAWAMLVVPLAVGLVLRQRASGCEWFHLPMTLGWLSGYFFFHAASLWFKAPPARRARYRRPALVYGGLTAGLGVLMLALGGAPMLWWTPWFAVLIGWAVRELTRKAERALSSGAATIAAAATMALVGRFGTPQAIWSQWHDASVRWDFWIAVALFGYFFGTVFHVKTLIRERGSARWLAYSHGYHAGWLALAVLGAGLDQISWWWTPLFAACLFRSWLLPRLAGTGRRVSPLRIGLVEIGLSAAATVVALAG